MTQASWLRACASLAVLLALCAGCRRSLKLPSGERRPVPPQRGGVLRTATYTDVRGLDPALIMDEMSGILGRLMYDQLVTYDAQGKLALELAETLDESQDGRKYVFGLRRGVLFHDGTELTAADFKRSLERMLHVDTPSPAASFYTSIAGYTEYHAGKTPELRGVRTEGRYTLTIELSELNPAFLHVLSLPLAAPVCASAGRVYRRNWVPCGTGPFKLKELRRGQVARFTRHSGYFDKGRPYLDGIEWQLSMPPSTQRFKLERGELDMVRDFGAADQLLFRSSAAWRAVSVYAESLATYGVAMNTELPPFDNRHMRRAVAFALDNAQVALLRPGQVTAYPRLVPRAILPDWPGMRVQQHDPARALEEMKRAGFAYEPRTGRGGYPKTIRLLALADSFGQSASEVHQQQLARIGIRVQLDVVGWPAYLAQIARRGTTAMASAGWGADYPDASSFFEPLFSSASIQGEESQNVSFFSNRELDSLLVEARRSGDAAARERLFRRAEEILVDEAPWAFGFTQSKLEIWQPYVQGYKPNPVLSEHVRFAWIDGGGRPARSALNGLESVLPRLAARTPRTTLAAVRGSLP
ncbi:MAG TPA: ABC transporter substrate-binding protein [Polyangiaceae bacterium]